MQPVWQGVRDFGLGEKLYRCVDITSGLGTSVFEYWNERMQCWRRLRNYDARAAMHAFVTGTAHEKPNTRAH